MSLLFLATGRHSFTLHSIVTSHYPSNDLLSQQGAVGTQQYFILWLAWLAEYFSGGGG